MFLAHYGRQDLPVLRSWDSLGRVVLQICRRYAAGSVRSGFWGKAWQRLLSCASAWWLLLGPNQARRRLVPSSTAVLGALLFTIYHSPFTIAP